MGRKSGWFSKVKKVFSHDSKAKKAEISKSKNKLHGKENTDPVTEVPNPSPIISVEEVNLIDVEAEQVSHAYSMAVYTAAPLETAASQTASHLTMYTQLTGKSREEVAAIRIQAAFRSYTARRGFRTLKSLIRLKSLVDGPIVKRHTSNTLKCMQGLSRVQSHIQSTRFRVLEENRALQRLLLQKRAKELESLRICEEWDDSLQSKEQIEDNLLHKYDAAMRREKALAYSYTHQQTWKKTSKSTNFLFMDPLNPQWGWSRLERWMSSLPSETTKSSKDTDQILAKTSTPTSQKVASSLTSYSKMAARKMKSASPKHVLRNKDDDSSSFAIQSDRNRRHSITGDNESLASSSNSVPSYMASTHSTKAKLKLPSPLGVESAKKRLSFTPSPVQPHRLSAENNVTVR